MIPALFALSVLTVGGYLTPEQAGFRDCMLIYEAEHRDAEDLGPCVADADQWTFDAFLFLALGPAPSGAAYHNGATTRDDWLAAMDRWFAKGRDVAALQEAVADASRQRGRPPGPRQVIFSLHYPSPAQRDFGDVDGDGRTEDLRNPDDRAKAIAWHVDQLIERFERAEHEGLELWGFYWMREGLRAEDEEAVRRASEIVHARGLRLLWIPYYRAPGFERWREVGFDAAILQPNYAFLSQHDGRIRYDRLLETASLAHDLGMGVEIETGGIATDARAREMFGDYLAFASDSIAGYGRAAKAYYQDTRMLRAIRDSKDGSCRATYADVLRLLRGEPVGRPGQLSGGEPALVDGRFRSELDPEAPTVATRDPIEVGPFAARRFEEAEVSFARGTEWRGGRVEIEVREGNGPWTSRAAREFVLAPRTERAWTQVVPVPLDVDGVTGLRIRCIAEDGEPLTLDEVSAVGSTSPAAPIDHARDLALGKPYTIAPAHERTYPDSGAMLTDGKRSERGWSEGRSVGWQTTGTTVLLDLGEAIPVDSVVLHCDGGGYASVEFPDSVGVRLYENEPLQGGLWSPEPMARLQGGSEGFRVSWRQQVGDGSSTSGSLTLAPPRSVSARWVQIDIAERAWLMLSEIEVRSGRSNAAMGRPYRCSPLPTAKAGLRYADDGRLLTDGIAPEGFEPKRVAGWRRETVEVVVDLGARSRIDQVRAHFLSGRYAEVVAPESVEVSVSLDGKRWTEAGKSRRSDPAGGTGRRLTLTTASVGEGRWVRLRFAPVRGWMVLSEIEVLGEEIAR